MSDFDNLPKNSIIRPDPSECPEGGLSADLWNIVYKTEQSLRLLLRCLEINLNDVPEDIKGEIVAKREESFKFLREDMVKIFTITEYYEKQINGHNQMTSNDSKKVDKSKLLKALMGLLDPERVAAFDENIYKIRKMGAEENIDTSQLRELCDEQHRLIYGVLSEKRRPSFKN